MVRVILTGINILKILLLCTVFIAMTVQADNATYPELDDKDEFSLMGLLSDHDWHDLKDERWNIYSQGTYISSFKQAFPAAYTNLTALPIHCHVAQSAVLPQHLRLILALKAGKVLNSMLHRKCFPVNLFQN